MRKPKSIVTRTAAELAEALGLSPLDAVEIEIRSELNARIIEIVRRSGLTHAQVARLARTSRSRVTAILNRDTHDVSTDLLLRIVAALGYRARITLKRVKRAA
jgi:predicted XRE-type DNA-binding protein